VDDVSLEARIRALKPANKVPPAIITMLGGAHATFMFNQVLTKAPWIDVIMRGEPSRTGAA